MKKFWKRTGILLLVLFAVMMIYAVLGLQKTTEMTINPVDLAKIPDGTYTGLYDCFRWTNKVEVTVQGHRIMQIRILKAQDGRDDLNRQLMDAILSEQRTDVDVITGATASSHGFLKAVELALSKAPQP